MKNFLLILIYIVFVHSIAVSGQENSNLNNHRFNIDSVYKRSYKTEDLRNDKTLIFDTVNFFIRLNETEDENGMLNTIYTYGNIKSTNKLGTLHKETGLLEYWVCDFENKIINEFHILKTDTSFKEKYSIDPIFHLEMTQMYSHRSGKELNKKEVRKFLYATPIK